MPFIKNMYAFTKSQGNAYQFQKTTIIFNDLEKTESKANQPIKINDLIRGN